MFSTKKSKSLLFMRPCYHSSYFLRDELRKLGWKADIFVPRNFPEQLLYSAQDVIWGPELSKGGKIKSYINTIILFFFFLRLTRGYQYLCYYGRADIFTFFEKQLNLDRWFGPGLNVCLSIAKLMGKKIIYMPSGCHDEELKSNFAKYDKGNICGNCGSYDRCYENIHRRHFQLVRRYSSFNIAFGFYFSSEYPQKHVKVHSFDLGLWSPDIEIPDKYQLPNNGTVKILHSFVAKNRTANSKNIKGSPYVFQAVERLQAEGYPVELIYKEKVPIADMRYVQAQADIVVEQLIYGLWGSTGAECMTLGKPVICYMNKDWKASFLKAFGYKDIPIVEADCETVYAQLKKLVMDADLRKNIGKASRQFALRHFNPEANAKALEKHILAIQE